MDTAEIHRHIASRVVAGNVTAFGYMMSLASIGSKAGTSCRLRGLKGVLR